MPTTVNTSEAAEIAGVDKSTFSRWVRAGKLSPIAPADGRQTRAMRFDRRAVEQFVAKRSETTKPYEMLPSQVWPKGTDPRKMMTVGQVMEATGVKCRDTIYAWVRDGKLNGYRLAGRQLRFAPADVKRLVARQG